MPSYPCGFVSCAERQLFRVVGIRRERHLRADALAPCTVLFATAGARLGGDLLRPQRDVARLLSTRRAWRTNSAMECGIGLRSAPTESEEILWSKLRGKRLGLSFRREVPVGRYIADFLAPSIRLAVEVDGGYHTTKQRRRLDKRRDREFRRLGYSVMRFPAAEVIRDVESVVDTIRQSIEAIEEHLDERARGWALYEDALDDRLAGRSAFWEA